jgi:glycosyltransferase involved in cell wall biosynthesis
VIAGSPRRVLFAHPYPDAYGADRVAIDVVVALRNAGIDPIVVLPEPGPMTAWLEAKALQYRFVGIPVIRRALLTPAGVLGLASRARRDFSIVARAISEIKPDLIYANTITLPHWVLGGRRANIPVVVHVHESDDRLRRTMARALTAPLLAADRVVAVSHAAKAFLVRAVPRLDARIQVVYNGLDAPCVNFPSPLDSVPARLAVIGRLSRNKGHDLAIAAASVLVAKGRNITLEVAGAAFAGYEAVEQDLRESVVALGLGDRVTFTGFCSDVWSLLGRTDIVLAPSRTDSLPLVVIEAMLAGRPIVAADVGGMRELISHGRSGLLVAREDVGALVSSVEILLDDPHAARRLGAHARSEATERFTSERFGKQIVAIAGEVLHGARSTRTPG